MKILFEILKNFHNRKKEKKPTEQELRFECDKKAYNQSREQLNEATRNLQQVIEENHFTINIKKAMDK